MLFAVPEYFASRKRLEQKECQVVHESRFFGVRIGSATGERDDTTDFLFTHSRDDRPHGAAEYITPFATPTAQTTDHGLAFLQRLRNIIRVINITLRHLEVRRILKRIPRMHKSRHSVTT